MTCAPSEDSDQPGRPPSLIRVFAVRMKKQWVPSYPLSAQRMPSADLSLRWALVILLVLSCGGSLVFAGTHYFMNMSEHLPCEKIYPVFLLYDMEGNLGAFGWVFQGRPGNFYSEDGMGWFHITPQTYPVCSCHRILKIHVSRAMRKCVLCHMRTTKARSLISAFVVRC